MRILVLGGTAWLGGTVASTALDRGHEVTCLARGQAGSVPAGARLVVADRTDRSAYDAVSGMDWDAVVDVSWQPGFVRAALAALGPRARHWTYVSSCSVYADQSTPGSTESAALLPALEGDAATREQYGEAKVACEQLCRSALPDRLLVARAGLIGGPGDVSDRSGYWPARFARAVEDGEPVLVPDDPDQPVQLIDVRDLAAWILACAEAPWSGVFNASGPVLRFADVIELARAAAGHDGQVVRVDPEWLVGQGVEEYMGPESLALWLHDPDWAGFSSRDTAAIARTGLTTRPVAQTLADVLPWERSRGLDRPRRAGLSAGREAELRAAWSAAHP
jgi:nucleoside-diphosphate-sugar epimerase